MSFGHLRRHMSQVVTAFRDEFIFPHKKVLQWFPGHMNRGLKQMEAVLKSVDCVLEVHDARIPISGRNPRLAESFLMTKPYILILNKCDLIPRDLNPVIESALKARENIDNIIFTNAKDQLCPGLNSIVKKAYQLIIKSERYNRSGTTDYNLMVIGVPNVGKSSLINALRSLHMGKKHSLAVAPIAGVTKALHERMRISKSPAVYLFDTPGIMSANIQSMESGMRLAACASFKDHLVGEETVADYLLYWLNKHGEFGYVSQLGLATPTDAIREVLVHICLQRNLRRKVRDIDGGYKEFPDLKSAAQIFITQFRERKFGTMVLDKDLLSVSL